jgi:hypothetical protein
MIATSSLNACKKSRLWNGNILSFPLVLGLITGEMAEGSVQIEHVSGIYAPNYQTLADNNWNLSWEVSAFP